MFQSNLFVYFCDIRGSYSDDFEVSSILGCYDLCIGKELLTFRKDYYTQKHSKTQKSISEEIKLSLCSDISYLITRLSFSSASSITFLSYFYIPILIFNFRLC